MNDCKQKHARPSRIIRSTIVSLTAICNGSINSKHTRIYKFTFKCFIDFYDEHSKDKNETHCASDT